MSESIRDIVRNVASGDKVAASDAFVNTMREKIGAAIEAKRIEVAQGMVGAGSEDFQTDTE